MTGLGRLGAWANAKIGGRGKHASDDQLHDLQVRQVELEMRNAELQRAQAATDAARAYYCDLYNLSPVGHCVLNAQGLIVEANGTAASLLAMTRDELLKQSLSRHVNKKDADVFEAFSKRLAEASEPQSCEVRMQRKTGLTFWAYLVAVPARDADGGPACRIVWCDVTARKQAEDEAQKAQRIESVGTLAGVMAHDFNNILQGLFGNIGLAKGEVAKDHPAFALLGEAEKNLARAVRLTQQLLILSKGGEPVKEEVHLGRLIEEVARLELAGSRATLVFREDQDLWRAEVDKGQIQQLIANLTSNARQSMPDGGALSITVTNAQIPKDFVPGLAPGNYIKVLMRDVGVGIDPKRLERIFDPFYTTKQSGNGLGLATVHAVIEKHQGFISVASELGKGTTFTFYLPAAVASAKRSVAKRAAAERAPAERGANVLVMDDEELVRNLVAKILRREGFSVETAEGGKEALDQYKRAMDRGAPFDAVIMDLTVAGGVGGKDAIKELLALDPGAKAIVSSGYSGDPVMVNYADYGFKGAAAKPYTMDELVGVLKRVLDA